MNDCYHLILETPNANLSAIMRHINGTYTQKYNDLKNTKGALFKGRFKAVLIDQNSYLVALGRYIHRRPIKAVKKLENYQFSSYPVYINLAKSPSWLRTKNTIRIFGENGFAKNYKHYVLHKNKDDFLEEIYKYNKIPHILGDREFIKKIEHKQQLKINIHEQIQAVSDIVNLLSRVFDVSPESIMKRQFGRARSNFPRKFAMYLSQIYLQKTLAQIASDFDLLHCGSSAKAIFLAKKELQNSHNSQYKNEIEMIENCLKFLNVRNN